MVHVLLMLSCMKQNIILLSALSLVFTACGDPTAQELEPTEGCVRTVSWSESLDLQLAGSVAARGDGVELDGLVDDLDGVDRDGTQGIDSEGNLLEGPLDRFFATNLQDILQNNSLHLEVTYEEDADGSCEALTVALDDDTSVVATPTDGAWRTSGLLGDRPLRLTFRGVTTEVTFHDIGVRVVTSDSGDTQVVVGGWMEVDEVEAAILASLDEGEVEEYDAWVQAILETVADIDLDTNGNPHGVSFAFATTF